MALGAVRRAVLAAAALWVIQVLDTAASAGSTPTRPGIFPRVAAEPVVATESPAEVCANDVDEFPPGAEHLFNKATGAFLDAFGLRPNIAAQAPGRVNLIGEHTDYTGGFVLPLALEMRTVVVGLGKIVPAEAEDECIILSLAQHVAGDLSMALFDANPATLQPGNPFWTNYVKGVVKQYSADLPEGYKFAFQAVFASDVPLGAGLSSSASLEVATATFLEKLSGVTPEPTAKALRCQAAEHEFCNMPCGIMDQFISVMGKAGHVVQIDCRSKVGTPVPMLADDVVVLVTNSNVKHALSDSEYPTRVAQCRAATAALQQAFPEVEELRDATIPMLEQIKASVDDVVYRRARHVISENQRVEAAVDKLKQSDFGAVGALMVQSHNSLRDDYEVSATELDVLVDLAVSFGSDVLGSRMTGGGFGGCTVTLVKASAADALTEHLKTGYKTATGLDADIFTTRPGTGASLLPGTK